MKSEMSPVQIAIQVLKEMVNHNDYRIKMLNDLEKSWKLDSPHVLVREITSLWEGDSLYLRKVIKVLESKKPKREKNGSKRSA